MKFEDTSLPGLKIVRPIVRADDRGYFVKPFQRSVFAEAGIELQFAETFFSRSAKNVVRGLHFQTPPKAQEKFVFCSAGSVTDYVLDIRTGSPTYGQFETFHLSSEDWTSLYIPIGFAHGFVATSSEDAVMAYYCSDEFGPTEDGGIRWNSAGIDWQVTDPIISEKDQNLPLFADYESPFTFSTTQTAR